MTCNETCRPMYSNLADRLRVESPAEMKKLKGLYVEGPSGARRDYYWVKVPTSEGYEVIWEGAACCKWSARFHALCAFSERFKIKCKICGQVLDDPNDSTTVDWGNGHCLKCTAEDRGIIDAIKQMYDITRDPKYKVILKRVKEEERMMEQKERLVKMHRDFYGSELSGDETDLSLILDILEQLISDLEEQKNHSHSLH